MIHIEETIVHSQGTTQPLSYLLSRSQRRVFLTPRTMLNTVSCLSYFMCLHMKSSMCFQQKLYGQINMQVKIKYSMSWIKKQYMLVNTCDRLSCPKAAHIWPCSLEAAIFSDREGQGILSSLSPLPTICTSPIPGCYPIYWYSGNSKRPQSQIRTLLCAVLSKHRTKTTASVLPGYKMGNGALTDMQFPTVTHGTS